MVWRAVQDKHAIERTRVSFSFKELLTTKTINKMYVSVDDIKADLGLNVVVENSPPGFQIQINKDGTSSSAPVESRKEWQFQKRIDNNKIVESVNMKPNELSFETTEYERWKPFLARLLAALSGPLETALQVTSINSISVEYWDRFLFIGEKGNAAPSLLLKNLEGNLHASALTGEKAWHLHKGWFEEYRDMEVLVNQNASSQDSEGSAEAESIRSLSLYTRVETKNSEQLENVADLENILQNLHVKSKQVFAEAITDEAIALVNL